MNNISISSYELTKFVSLLDLSEIDVLGGKVVRSLKSKDLEETENQEEDTESCNEQACSNVGTHVV